MICRVNGKENDYGAALYIYIYKYRFFRMSLLRAPFWWQDQARKKQSGCWGKTVLQRYWSTRNIRRPRTKCVIALALMSIGVKRSCIVVGLSIKEKETRLSASTYTRPDLYSGRQKRTKPLSVRWSLNNGGKRIVWLSSGIMKPIQTYRYPDCYGELQSIDLLASMQVIV